MMSSEERSEIARRAHASMSPEDLETWHRNLSVGVRVGLAAMTPEDKTTMYKHISESLNNMSEADKAERARKISESVRATNAARNALIECPSVPDGFGEWFTGFWEGDGDVCCMLRVNWLGSGYVFSPEIEFAQKDADVVEYIASVLTEGRLGWAERKQGLYRQLRWSAQKQCIPILRLLSLYVVSNVSCTKINTAMYQMRLPFAITHELTMQWLVGFWDAEGSVEGPNNSVRSAAISFYQKDVSLLRRIQCFLGFGKLTEPVACPRLICRGEDGRGLAMELLRHSRVERKRDMLRRRFGLDD